MYLTLTKNESSCLFLKWLRSLAFAKIYCYFYLFLSFSVLHVSTSLLHLDQSDLGFFLNNCQCFEYKLERFCRDVKINLTSSNDLVYSVISGPVSSKSCCLWLAAVLSFFALLLGLTRSYPPSPTFQAGLMLPGMPVAQTRIVWVRKGSLTSSLRQGTTLSQRRHPNLSHPLLQERRSPGAAWWKITVQTRVAHPPQRGPVPLAARVVAVRCVAWPAAVI